MLAKWPIRNKLLIGISLLLVIVTILSYSGFHGLYAYRSLVRGLSRRVYELPLANEFSQRVSDLRVTLSETRGLRDMQSAGLGTSPLGARLAREEFRTHLQNAKNPLARYREMLVSSDDDSFSISDNRREWQTVGEIDKTLARIADVNHDEDWLFDKVRFSQLSAEVDHLQRLAADLPSFLHDNIREFTAEARNQYRTLIFLTWFTSVTTVVMFVLFVHLVYRWILRPLRVLVKGSRKMAAGNFHYRIALNTSDEMAELAEALNDMTSRFRDIRDDLDRQVQERTKQVVRNEQLASVGFLAAGVAHEINNPLASIALGAESLEGRLREMLDGNQTALDAEECTVVGKYLRMIQSEAFRCKGITEKLLDFSRMGEVKRAPTDLRELVEGVIEMIGHLGKYQEKKVEFSYGPSVTAAVNSQEIKQVVLNLLTNALDSLDPGGKVAVELSTRNGQAELVFTDNGCGMTAEVLEHLFEPFFTRRRNGQGTGLGLSITYRIVADHEGTIAVHSDGPGCGSQFRVRLPLTTPPPSESEHQSYKEPPIATKPRNRLKLLFADDERSLQELMSLELPRMGHEVTVCPDGVTAVAALERNTYDCILVDLDMPRLSGLEVIAKAKELSPDTEAIILTGKSSLETAVAALRKGAFDYLTKPCKLAELEALLNRVAEKRELVNKYRALKRQLERIEGDSKLVGETPHMQKVRSLISKVAPTNSTVLILGETGTGKELVARAVHDQSLRAAMPFVAINCGGLPESLIESELFGHRKGSFTGADEHRVGLFEVANGGTMFLDEIGELPKSMQAKLLRVLESGEIRRVGDNESFIVDVRVVCATHRDLEEMVAEEDFREDLMFRINTFEIQLPALRDRVEDIPKLAHHLASRFRQHVRPDDPLFTPDALQTLQAHNWPGNVRELANAIEHATILCDEGPIASEHLPNRFGAARRIKMPQLRAVSGKTLRDIEIAAIQQALDRHAGNKPKAAEELGISLKTLYNKLSQLSQLEQSA